MPSRSRYTRPLQAVATRSGLTGHPGQALTGVAGSLGALRETDGEAALDGGVKAERISAIVCATAEALRPPPCLVFWIAPRRERPHVENGPDVGADMHGVVSALTGPAPYLPFIGFVMIATGDKRRASAARPAVSRIEFALADGEPDRVALDWVG